MTATTTRAAASRKRKGIVVAPQPMAASVGVDILRAGGNALDAAIATAFAQGIVDPCNGGIGGFGTMLVHDAAKGKTVAYGYHGRAGSKARPDVFAKDVIGQIHGHAERYDIRGAINQIGYRSVVVPGVPAGFEAAHRAHGRLPWAALFEPAIQLARDGIPLPGESGGILRPIEKWTKSSIGSLAMGQAPTLESLGGSAVSGATTGRMHAGAHHASTAAHNAVFGGNTADPSQLGSNRGEGEVGRH